MAVQFTVLGSGSSGNASRLVVDGFVTEICESLFRGASFPCHETTDAIEDDGGFAESVATADSVQCAGAEIFLAKQGMSTQLSRIAERLGMDVSTLDMSAPVCGSHDEMLKAHLGESDGGQP